jgi:hypothetical protein
LLDAVDDSSKILKPHEYKDLNFESPVPKPGLLSLDVLLLPKVDFGAAFAVVDIAADSVPADNAMAVRTTLSISIVGLVAATVAEESAGSEYCVKVAAGLFVLTSRDPNGCRDEEEGRGIPGLRCPTESFGLLILLLAEDVAVTSP